MWNFDRGYCYGVLLGDGFYEKAHQPRTPARVMLKSIDRDFVEYWRDTIMRLCGTKYSIYISKSKLANRHDLYLCRVYAPEFAIESFELTCKKTSIPDEIKNGIEEVKKGFIQGVMDSEGWITARLCTFGPSRIQMTVGVTDPWLIDLHRMFEDIGVETGKIHIRKFSDNPKYLKPRKNLLYFDINIPEYVQAGLDFNIKRKSDRLAWCSKILRDYTRDYPKYKDYFEMDDIVRPRDESPR